MGDTTHRYPKHYVNLDEYAEFAAEFQKEGDIEIKQEDCVWGVKVISGPYPAGNIEKDSEKLEDATIEGKPGYRASVKIKFQPASSVVHLVTVTVKGKVYGVASTRATHRIAYQIYYPDPDTLTSFNNDSTLRQHLLDECARADIDLVEVSAPKPYSPPPSDNLDRDSIGAVISQDPMDASMKPCLRIYLAHATYADQGVGFGGGTQTVQTGGILNDKTNVDGCTFILSSNTPCVAVRVSVSAGHGFFAAYSLIHELGHALNAVDKSRADPNGPAGQIHCRDQHCVMFWNEAGRNMRGGSFCDKCLGTLVHGNYSQKKLGWTYM